MCSSLKWGVAWSGLPHYGLGLLEHLASILGDPEFVLSTDGPVRSGLASSSLSGKIRWVHPDDKPESWGVGFDAIEVFLVSGWAIKGFRALMLEAHDANCKTICMVDNSWRGSARQHLGRLYYRMTLRKAVDWLLVPGRLAHEFGVKLGHPPAQIKRGLYGVDDAVFRGADGLSRDIDVLYAGQFIERKGIGCLLDALKVCKAGDNKIRVAFAGGQRDQWSSPIPDDIEVLGFLSPAQLSSVMRRSKVFVLPSQLDHWGVVVLEAAQSGCLLAVSDAVGAGADLVGGKNGRVFKAGSASELADAILGLLSLGDAERDAGQHESLALSKAYHLRRTSVQISELIRELGARKAGRSA